MLISGSPEDQRHPGGGYGLGNSLWDDSLGPPRCCLGGCSLTQGLSKAGTGHLSKGMSPLPSVSRKQWRAASSGQPALLFHPLTNTS